MSKQKHNIKSREDVLDLEARFLDGERITTDQILGMYFTPKNYMEGLSARDSVKSYISTLKKRFGTIHGLWFGVLNNEHQYGLPQTAWEFRFVIESYRARIQGNLTRVVQAFQDGVNKKVISGSTQPLALPFVPDEETKTSKK